MARHRNVRGYNYDEDFDDDDLYGQSVEDDYCISPATAAQFIYSKREKPTTFAEPLEEEFGDEEEPGDCDTSDPSLSGPDQARLYSCLDHMREVLGDSVAEQEMIQAVLSSKFDVSQALDLVLTRNDKQNMKTASSGKSAKGALSCSVEGVSNVCNWSNLPKNISHDTDTSLGLGDLIAKVETVSTVAAESRNKMHFGTTKINIPLETQTSLGFCLKGTEVLPLSALMSNIPKQSFYCPSNKQKTGSHVNTTSPLGSFLNPDSDIHLVPALIEAKVPENLPQQQHICKSLGAQNGAGWSSFMNTRNTCLTSCLENMTFDNQASHSPCGDTELFGSLHSVLQSSQGDMPSEKESFQVSKYGSPSLADLIQEHKWVNSQASSTLKCDLQDQPLEEGLESVVPLSRLARKSQTSCEMPELTDSLSSPADRQTRHFLRSDLIAEGCGKMGDSRVSSAVEFQPAVEVDSNIDLSVLIKNPEPLLDLSSMLNPPSKSLSSKQKIHSRSSKESKLCNKMHTFRKQTPHVSWTRAPLTAKPSAFALTLCFCYTPRYCSRNPFDIHETLMYSSQVQGAETTDKNSLISLIPFDFKTPSPDDIVKANQRKAFTRE
uniref:HBS1-like protein isoform X3 n=1 Tax=Geotrypetes seraphini TaxID=260995 RepID=A0A6P8Q665_GEOSA|nr:HBS1-like protein isoform X3 [Geotrypetes seraphini]